jgi:hypothetical protein
MQETPLLPFDEVHRRLRPSAGTYVGVRPVPVGQIIGTEGRGGDFDRSFRPRRDGVRARMRSVAQAFPHGDFPPIVAYKLGDAYFVLDGHHRVALARLRGTEWIDAELTELHSRWQLSAAADFVELVHAEQERLFVEQSGLGEARPAARIRFSRPSGYPELLETIEVHGYRRAVAEGRVLSPAEVADDWYEHAYRPALAAIAREGLAAACPQATDADRVLYLHQRRRELSVEHGDLPLVETASRLAEEQRKNVHRRLPRVLRWYRNGHRVTSS